MYQGHLNDGSSIQKHSAGAHYPFVVGSTESGAFVMAPNGTIFYTTNFRENTKVAREAAYGRATNKAIALANP